MRKYLFILFFLILAWLIKLSFNSYQYAEQLNALMTQDHQIAQHYANLNDQVIALQRNQLEYSQALKKSTSPRPAVKASKAPSPAMSAADENTARIIQPAQLFKQQLQLAQFAVQQQQYVYALEQLNEIKQSLDHYAIAASIQQSLTQAIDRDIKSIQHFVLSQQQQQQHLEQVLSSIDGALIDALQQQQLSPSAQNQHFWQRWFQIEQRTDQHVDLVHRRYILKEVQLRTLLAKQALIRGEAVEFREMLNIAMLEIQQLPDASSQKIKQQLKAVQNASLVAAPQLTALDILG
ncbi:hypothetical protein [Acinetobacter larvae]|uniref:Uncharacterized protein n=1 Tax=Acinetobacter larvae TaxID=1789224 RepID=A0A1B2M2W5_9GAMM|nr:hypothetical protein [Acinetobacter larvae]AOA59546.1 hypothetical protein BFG52_15135 [Acinetobacter larvae]